MRAGAVAADDLEDDVPWQRTVQRPLTWRRRTGKSIKRYDSLVERERSAAIYQNASPPRVQLAT